MLQLQTYSFLDVYGAISGPGGNFSLGSDAGAAEEGITIEAAGDKDTLTIGADGSPMHNLNADKSGKITVRLLKTSPVNAQLANMYSLQTRGSAFHGQSVITIRNVANGDVITGRSVAFAKAPTLTYAKEGAMNEWEFNAGIIDRNLGVGTPALN